MPELNKANRQVCDVDIRILSTKEPFLFFDTANTTSTSITGDSVYAMAKGTKRVAFQNPPEGTIEISAQVVPFKIYAMFSDGTIQSDALYADKQTITATTDGELDITVENGEIQDGTIYVYESGEFGNDAIEGTYADGVFTAENSEDIVADTEYEVGYIVNRTSGVNRVSIATNKLPKDFFITMNTVEKDEQGTLTPYIITVYKASVQRNLDLSFSSEGDPTELSFTFDVLEDADGNFFDIIEDYENAE